MNGNAMPAVARPVGEQVGGCVCGPLSDDERWIFHKGGRYYISKTNMTMENHYS